MILKGIKAAGKKPEFISVSREVEQRSYFPFYNYEYCLNVDKQLTLMPDVKPLAQGLRESFSWYQLNQELVNRKPLLAYIDANFKEML